MEKLDICVVGTGYVGLVTGTCLAEVGHRVICVDSDPKKLASLKAGRIPIYEPGIEKLFHKNVREKRLSFAATIAEGMNGRNRRAKVIFIAVGTPPRPDGSADLSAVEAVAETVAKTMSDYTVVVDKSTVPVETGEWVARTIQRFNKRGVPYDVVSNPEFLSEGSAVNDFLHPDRIVLGVASKRAEAVMRAVYAPIKSTLLITDVKSAELIKHASNSFLATKISFINAVSALCDKVGADVTKVALGMGLDRRIGPQFLRAGIGFGGFCLHPDEPIILRDPLGNIRALPIRLAYDLTRAGDGPWEALSLDPKAGRVGFTPIGAVSRRPYDGLLIRVKTKMGKEVRTTADHPFLVRSGDGWETRPASDLNETSWLPSFLSIPHSPRPLRVDLIESLKARRPEYFDRILVRPRDGRPWNLKETARKALSRINKSRPFRTHDIIRRRAPLSLPEFLILDAEVGIGHRRDQLELGTAKGAGTYVPAELELSAGFCRVLGHIAAEGCLTQERGLRGTRERVSVHFHEDEREYLRDLTGILKTLGIKFMLVHVPQHKTRRIVVSSRLFAFLLRDVLGCGKDSYSARVPDAVLTSPDPQRLAFLLGAIRGDGSWSFPKHSPAVTCEFGTASPAMSLGMQTLFHSLGIVPGHKQAFQNKSTVPAHFLRVSGASQIRLLAGAKGAAMDRVVAGRLARLKSEPAPAGHRKLGPELAMVRVTSAERTNYRGFVYSLEIPGDETFALPNGLILHNCFPKDLEAFYWISKQKGYDFALLKTVLEINDHQKAWVTRKIEENLWNLEGKTVALLGLAFKPHTDDMRFAPSCDIALALRSRKVNIRAFDPVSMPKAKRMPELKGVRFCKDAYDCAKGADALVLVTEWPEFKALSLGRLAKLLRSPILLDGRNLFDPKAARAAGFTYCGVGRP